MAKQTGSTAKKPATQADGVKDNATDKPLDNGTGTGEGTLDAAAAAAAAAQAAADAEAAAQAEAAAKLAQEQADAEAAQAAADAAARAALEAEADAAAKAAAVTFPRDMLVINDTAREWVVRRHVPRSSSVEITVRDEDDLHRLRQNCADVLAISDHYKPVDGALPALRIVEIDGEQA